MIKMESQKNNKKENNEMIGKYVVVRADKAGVFAGILKEKKGCTVTLTECRRLYYWCGALDTLTIATSGVAAPEQCKFSIECESIEINNVLEIIECTNEGEKSIRGVEAWKM